MDKDKRMKDHNIDKSAGEAKFDDRTALYMKNIINKRLNSSIVVMKMWEKMKVFYLMSALVLFANLVSTAFNNGLGTTIVTETFALSFWLGFVILTNSLKSSKKIDIDRINFESFSEIVNEDDNTKVLNDWVGTKYIQILKDIEDKKGEETKNTCIIDFIDKVINISDENNRDNTWEKVTKPNFLRTAAEVFWILFKPAMTLVVMFRLVWIVVL